MYRPQMLRRLHLPPWVPYAITAAVCWGVWAVLAKGPSRELSGWMTQVLFTFALIPSLIVAWRSKQVDLGTNKVRGLAWGFLSGLVAAIGDLCFYLALQSGAETAIAIPLISLYPLVTLAIAFCCFKERLNRLQAGGIFLALLAIILLTAGERILTQPVHTLRRLSLSPSFLYTSAAWLCAGAFTAIQKLSTKYVSVEMSYFAWCAAFTVISSWIVATKTLNWNMPITTAASALAAGALNGLGVIASFDAYRRGGKAAVVAPLTATVQPVVTVLLALVFLHEHVGLIETCGILLAICAAAALSQEAKPPPVGRFKPERSDQRSIGA